MIQNIAFLAATISLGIAAYSDIKTREVPDWLSYSTIFFGIGLRILFSAVFQDWSYIINGVLGFLVFLIVGLIMFYTGQWGGGDSKLLMGIGVLLGLEPVFKIPLLLIFWINALFVGAFYGLLYSIYLAYKHKRRFTKRYIKLYRTYRLQRYVLISFSIMVILVAFLFEDPFLKITMAFLALFLLVMAYIIIFIKAIEDVAMKKFVSVEKLTEGDWIVKDVVIDGKRICGPKDLGIEKKQIQQLIKLKKKKKIDKILIKEGIPFVPGFFFAMILTILVGNWIVYLF